MSHIDGNILVGQSGGPTTAINSSLCGIIEEASRDQSIHTIYGLINGIEGLLNHHFLNLSSIFHKKENLKLLKTTPSMYLGSCRYKLPAIDEDSHTYEKIFEAFSRLNIKYFFYIGGNDSMDTVMKLSQYAKQISFPIHIIGVPKTIDNDLAGTDHTPGFGSAAKYVATSLLEITHDSYIYNAPSVTIVEIMGRNAGWLTAASVLARSPYNTSPDLIYLPEVPFHIYEFLKDLKRLQETKKNIIVAVSEGIKDDKGNYIADTSSKNTDGFGHSQLSGVGKTLENLVKDALGCKVRSIELSVLQRSAMHISSKTDLEEAHLIGRKAVLAAQEGLTGKMMVFERAPKEEYTISINTRDIQKIANVEKKIPRAWINEAGNDVTQDLIDYLTPLILGEAEIEYRNGLPRYFDISHLHSQNDKAI